MGKSVVIGTAIDQDGKEACFYDECTDVGISLEASVGVFVGITIPSAAQSKDSSVCDLEGSSTSVELDPMLFVDFPISISEDFDGSTTISLNTGGGVGASLAGFSFCNTKLEPDVAKGCNNNRLRRVAQVEIAADGADGSQFGDNLLRF